MTPVPVVLDVDTGVDDACAVLFAARHPGIELRAVTCVAGNTDVDQVVRNTRTVLEAAGRPVNLVPLAPLTNVALLLRTYPQAAAGLARIVFMGGAALVGDATAAAEFNVCRDPEAAAVVLDAAAALDVPVTMYGLDVFSGPRVTRAQAAALEVDGERYGRLWLSSLG